MEKANIVQHKNSVKAKSQRCQQEQQCSANRPLTFLVVALVLLCVAFLASSLPARRAMRVDPMAALRYE